MLVYHIPMEHTLGGLILQSVSKVITVYAFFQVLKVTQQTEFIQMLNIKKGDFEVLLARFPINI